MLGKHGSHVDPLRSTHSISGDMAGKSRGESDDGELIISVATSVCPDRQKERN